MKKIVHHLAIFALFIGSVANAQDIVWTGAAANNDFFDEGNWKNAITNAVPSVGAIDAGVAINLPLKIDNVVTRINAAGEINLGTTGSLSLSFLNLTAQSFAGAGGTVFINEGAFVELTDAAPFKETIPKVRINFTSGLAWVKTTKVSARIIDLGYTGHFAVNGNNGVYQTNLRLDNYYRTGCVIRSNDAATSPLTVYDGANLQGSSALIPVTKIHSSNTIPGGMNDKIESFLLKKGFMVTFSAENDGTGSSKNFIASESDLIINSFPKLLQNSISFIRVMPWNWVSKKGRNESGLDLNTAWRYQWNHTESSSPNWEFAPMSWGHGTTTDPEIAKLVDKYGSPYIMSFNEPDDCDGQSGQYGFPDSPKLCDIDEAVKLHRNFMKTGMRIVSPGGREEAPFGWLKNFYAKASAQDVRIDVIAVHWYDWSSNPVANPNPTAQQVFNRFKAYLTKVHDLYGLPIWITEFNANPARSQAINAGFLALALPYLESLEYIERYCWFPFNNGTHWYTSPHPSTDFTLSLVGTIYKNINNANPVASTPSVPEATLNQNNNLNLLTFPNIALNKPATASSLYNSTFLAAKAFDGDSSTGTSQWVVNFGAPADISLVALPAWIEVDLQGSFALDSFRIVDNISASKDFSFQVWDAGLNSGAGGWANALTVTGNPATSLTTFRNLAPVTTTKVRLYITSHNSTDYLRLLELEVFGKKVESLSINKFEKQEFTLYPNPVNNGVLNIGGEQEIISVEVYNILGAKVNASFENSQVNVSSLTPGVYILRINDKYSYKFVNK